jgi:hypothetical protein
MGSWSTEAIKERERFSFWLEVVGQTVFNISSETPLQLFSGRITARSCGPIRFAKCQTTGDSGDKKNGTDATSQEK